MESFPKNWSEGSVFFFKFMLANNVCVSLKFLTAVEDAGAGDAQATRVVLKQPFHGSEASPTRNAYFRGGRGFFSVSINNVRQRGYLPARVGAKEGGVSYLFITEG